MTTVDELLTPPTPQDTLRALLALLTVGGLPATAWQSGSVPRTLLAAEADWLSDLGAAISAIAKGGWLEDAEGDWLTYLARNVFGLERLPAATTTGVVWLTDVANAGPFNIDQGSIVVSDGSRMLRFIYAENLTRTLPLGGTEHILVQAESPGAAYNLAAGSISVLLTAVPGVEVTNRTDWLVTQGADVESDVALRARCRARWGTLSNNSLEQSYESWALSVAGVSRATVTNDPATGTVHVYVAGPSGPVGYAVGTAANAVLQAKTPLTVHVVTHDATPSATPIAGILYVQPAYDIDVTVAKVKVAFDAYARATPIGGNPGATIVRDALIQLAMETPGVRDFDLTSPATNQSLSLGVAFTPAYALSGSR